MRSIGRLHKAINVQRREDLKEFRRKLRESKDDTAEDSNGPGHGNLQQPQKVILSTTLRSKFRRPLGPATCSGSRIFTSPVDATNSDTEYERWMMKAHKQRVRVFDGQDNLMFDHISNQEMRITHTLELCTNLVRHLNTIALTSELEMQIAMGTIENLIIAQLSATPLENSQFPSWYALEPCNSSQIEEIVPAIATIRQGSDRKFTGNLADDLVGTTFQLQ